MEKDLIKDAIIFLKCVNYEKPICNRKLMNLIAWGLADNEKEEAELNTGQLNKICNECGHFKTEL